MKHQTKVSNEEFLFLLIDNKINTQKDFINNSLITMIIKFGLQLITVKDEYFIYHKEEYQNISDRVLLKNFIDLVFNNNSITSTVIEKSFTDTLIQSNMSISHLDYTSLEEFKNQCGVYFIYNKYDKIIYIGKSINMNERPLVSFMNKIPHGATYIRLFCDENLGEGNVEYVETVAIDYYSPIYNTLTSKVEGTYKFYTKLIKLIEQGLTDKITPIKRVPVEDSSNV